MKPIKQAVRLSRKRKRRKNGSPEHVPNWTIAPKRRVTQGSKTETTEPDIVLWQKLDRPIGCVVVPKSALEQFEHVDSYSPYAWIGSSSGLSISDKILDNLMELEVTKRRQGDLLYFPASSADSVLIALTQLTSFRSGQRAVWAKYSDAIPPEPHTLREQQSQPYQRVQVRDLSDSTEKDIVSPQVLVDGDPARSSVYQSGSTAEDGNYVYVMSTRSFTHLKIGYTNDIPRRTKEVGGTNLPYPSKTEYWVRVKDEKGLEAAVHRKLREFRTRRKAEYFDVELPDAVNAIRELAQKFGYIDERVLCDTIDGVIPTREQWEEHVREVQRQRELEEEKHRQDLIEQRKETERLQELYESYRTELQSRFTEDKVISEAESKQRGLLIAAIFPFAALFSDETILFGIIALIVLGVLANGRQKQIDEQKEKYSPMSFDRFRSENSSR
jgi:hypothetical protein